MRPKRIEAFKIESMDSLGQGVSKLSDRVTFIGKTLPDEEGDTEIFVDRKGVSFGMLKNLKKPSTQRIESICPHFNSCPSCHYLHTSYSNEIEFKLKSFEKLFYKLPLSNIKVIQSPKRVGYRNRIQLHYDTKLRLLGMFNSLNHTIVPVPNCLIAVGPVLDELKKLYLDNSWLLHAPENQPRGHVEIYFKDGKVQVTWNRPYAEGGFTQVYAEMNELMNQEVAQWMATKSPTNLLDLFAGAGNLSNKLHFNSRLCVDLYKNTPGEDFISTDLYESGALSQIKKELKRRNWSPEIVLIDPPRSGMKDINLWLEEFKPQYVAYVSCDPHTLIRDLLTLTHYQISQAYLLDFFPSTFHFESLIFLERKG